MGNSNSHPQQNRNQILCLSDTHLGIHVVGKCKMHTRFDKVFATVRSYVENRNMCSALAVSAPLSLLNILGDIL